MLAKINFSNPNWQAMILQNLNNSYLLKNMFEISNVTVSLKDQRKISQLALRVGEESPNPQFLDDQEIISARWL